MNSIAIRRRPDATPIHRGDAEPREEIPSFVCDGILRVERSGFADMWDRETVLMLAATFGHDDAAEWLAMRRHLYFIALRQAHEAAVSARG